MKALILTILIALIGCDDTGKMLFSKWETKDKKTTLNLTDMDYGDNSLVVGTEEFGICLMDLYILGDNNGGVYEITNDDCGVFDESGTYTNNGTELELCSDGECGKYY